MQNKFIKVLFILLLIFVYIQVVHTAPTTWPVPSSTKISGVYGDWRGPTSEWYFHPSIDIEASVGDPVFAVEDGIATRIV